MNSQRLWKQLRATGDDAGRGAGRIAAPGRYPVDEAQWVGRGHCETGRALLRLFAFFTKCCISLREAREVDEDLIGLAINASNDLISFSELECHRLCALYICLSGRVYCELSLERRSRQQPFAFRSAETGRVNLNYRGGAGESEICP